MQQQTTAVPGSQRAGQTGSFDVLISHYSRYRNAGAPLLSLDQPLGSGVFTTVPQIFETGLAKNPDGPCLGRLALISNSPTITYADKYEWMSYRQVEHKRRNVGSATWRMFKSGGGSCGPDVGSEGTLETVGLWMSNRPEFQVVDLAMQAYGKVSVALYDTIDDESAYYILNHAEVSIIFTASSHIPSLLKLSHRLPSLNTIISVDPIPTQTSQIYSAWSEQRNLQILTLDEVEQLGAQNPVTPPRISPDQVVQICYTSGTTGKPKGALLTHGSLALSIWAQWKVREYDTDLTLLSYLPLMHIFGRLIELLALGSGGRIAFSTGDPLRILADAQIAQPTYFPSVPRVLNRIYQAAMAANDVPGIRGAIFRHAVAVKTKQMREGGGVVHPFWDRVVFSKVAAVLGGKVKYIASGAAPISPEILEFLRIAFSCDAVEGYGMTENCGTATAGLPGDFTSAGTVGPPHICTELKLVDVPDMSYTSLDKPNPRGEICTRGPSTFKGYYKDPLNTKAALDEEGWLHTGDIGEFDHLGRLKIIDRMKNIVKLSQGKYIALEHIENVYSSSPAVLQIFIYGDALQPYPVAVVVVDPAYLIRTALAIGQPARSTDEILRNEVVKAAFIKELTEWGRQRGLNSLELVRRIHWSVTPLTTLTPTMKVKRRETYIAFKKEIDAMYALGEVKPTTNASGGMNGKL